MELKEALSNLQYSWINKIKEEGISFSLMLIGPHGVGKTTFINSMIGKAAISSNMHSLPLTTLLMKKLNISITEFKFLDSEFKATLEIIEIDGFGDHMDFTGIENYVENIYTFRFDNYFRDSVNNMKEFTDDKRIHLCLYFFEPINYIKEVDKSLIKKLSSYTTILPIISKSDLLSNDDQSIIKDLFLSSFEHLDIPTLPINPKLPYFVSSDEFTKDNTAIQQKREYPWENEFIENKMSDFESLKNLIFSDGLLYLINKSDNHFYNYRRFKEAEEMIFKNPKILDKETVTKYQNIKKEIELLKGEAFNILDKQQKNK